MKPHSIMRPIKILLISSILICSMTSCSPKASAPAEMQELQSASSTDFYISETGYAETMEQIVLPYIDSYLQSGYFTAQDGSQIYYEQYLLENSTNHLVISHGFSESAQKYRETIYYFLKKGYSVSILDHRSHGYSQRYTEDNSKVHITEFDDFISDFKTFMDTLVVTDDSTDYYLFAHSMGGAIGALFLENYPQYFKAAVLSSPMMAIDTGICPELMAKGITEVANLTGFGEAYVLGQGPYEAVIDLSNMYTTSETRYVYYTEKVMENTALQLNGGSFSWLKECQEATEQLIQNADKVSVPVLVFQAEKDTLVRPEGHYAFVDKAQDAQLIYVKGARHELYNAGNDILVPYFNQIFSFLESQGAHS